MTTQKANATVPAGKGQQATVKNLNPRNGTPGAASAGSPGAVKAEETTKPGEAGTGGTGAGATATDTQRNPDLLPAKLDLPPFEDRVHKVQELFDKVSRHEKLSASLRLLQSLDTSTENRLLKITIEDGDEEWETTNSDAIRFCIDTLKDALRGKIYTLEQEIKF